MKPFERSCLYHSIFGMKVIEAENEDEYKRLLATNEWFDHPLKVVKVKLELNVKEKHNHEKQIRQRSRKRFSPKQSSAEQIGSGT